MATSDAFTPRPGLPRAVECVVALLALVLLSPLLLLSAAAVAVSSRGPILFRQQRIGRGGTPFTFYKFRSMRTDLGGLSLTASGDRRVTRVGKILRKFKLDELPELWNVVQGHLSLVGPRPEVPGFVDPADPLWQAVLSARPGLTDPVTLRLRNEEELLGAVAGDREQFYRSILLPFKLRGYRGYLARRSWRSDLRVLWDTFLGIVFPGRNPAPTTGEIRFLWESEEALATPQELAQPSLLMRHLSKVQLLLDITVLVFAFTLAYGLRFELQIPPAERHNLLVQLPLVVLIQLAACFLNGIHNFVWRYVSLSEIPAFSLAALSSAVPLVVLRYSLPPNLSVWRVPLSVIVMDAILAFGMLLGMRVVRRLQYERGQRRLRRQQRGEGERRPVLLIGAGQYGVLAAREMETRGDSEIEIQGFVDEDPLKQGTVIRGLRVLGTLSDLSRLVRAYKIHHVIITIANASPLQLSRIVQICAKVPVEARIPPGLYEILDGRVEVQRESADEAAPLTEPVTGTDLRESPP